MNWSENSEMHTFVVCAYKESPYLENCLKSLKKNISFLFGFEKEKAIFETIGILHIIRRILNMSQLHIRMMCTMKIMLNVY